MLFLYVMMASVLSGASAEVVSDFREKCGDFFVNGVSPRILTDSKYRHQCKKICQTLHGNIFYATLYDTSNKIPVYSAYMFNRKIHCERKPLWCIEPELEITGKHPDMKAGNFGPLSKQAVNDDYKNSNYDRGHLAPVLLASSQRCADATFTLTNAAPQDRSFNRGQWRVLEEQIAEELNKQCLPRGYTAYIVTGVVPGAGKVNSKVTVPSHFWTAYCCLGYNKKCESSRGFIGENKNVTPKNTSVKELEEMLKILYKVKFFKLFTEAN